MIKSNWQKLLLEMLMVMIGVLLALLVDEWREDRQLARAVDLTRDRILGEINENREALNDHSQRIRERYAKLQAWQSTLDLSKSFREQSGFPGIPFVFLNDAAWSRANSSDITNFMDSRIIEEAHVLYKSNDMVMNASTPLLDLIYSPVAWETGQTQVVYNVVEDIYQEVISQVQQSLNAYDEFAEAHPN